MEICQNGWQGVEVEEIQKAVDSDPYNKNFQEDLAHVLMAFQDALHNEEECFWQRTKVRWLAEGDSNTAFFHWVVKEKNNRNRVVFVMDTHGEVMSGPGMEHVFIEHFCGILGEIDDGVVLEIPFDFFEHKLSVEDVNCMIRPITKDEVKRAMFDIGDDQAPRSDGFSSNFFKALWEIVGADVELAVQDFFYRGRLARELNHTLLCLIP